MRDEGEGCPKEISVPARHNIIDGVKPNAPELEGTNQLLFKVERSGSWGGGWALPEPEARVLVSIFFGNALRQPNFWGSQGSSKRSLVLDRKLGF